MDERAFQHLADETFGRVEDALRDVDADDVDVDRAGDVVTLTLRGDRRCILNTQRPTRQLWLAFDAHAWHFSYDEERRAWVDDRHAGGELFATIEAIVRESTGVTICVKRVPQVEPQA